MARSDYPLLAKEGWAPVLTVTLALAIAWRVDIFWLLPPLALLALYLILLFRDPQRRSPAEPLGVVCPVDGRVIAIDEVEEGVLNRKAVRITLSVSSLGVYTARSPISGKVMDLLDHTESAVRDRSRGGLWLRDEAGDDIVVLFSALFRLGRPIALTRYGERLGQGQRAAYLRFARRAYVYLPINVRLEVQAGQGVVAGSQLLGYLVRGAAIDGSADKPAS